MVLRDFLTSVLAAPDGPAKMRTLWSNTHPRIDFFAFRMLRQTNRQSFRSSRRCSELSKKSFAKVRYWAPTAAREIAFGFGVLLLGLGSAS